MFTGAIMHFLPFHQGFCKMFNSDSNFRRKQPIEIKNQKTHYIYILGTRKLLNL